MKRSFIKRFGAYLLAAILVSALAGCVSKEEPEPVTTSTGAPASGTTAEPTKPLGSSLSPPDALAQSMRAQLEAKSYRVRISSFSSTVQGETLVEYVAPDRIHMTNPISEMIGVGSETYARQGQGPWQKAPFNAGEIAATFRDPKLIEDLTTNYDIKFVGTDTLDGAPMMVYEYAPKATSPASRSGKTKVWISTEDSLPRKVETQGVNNTSVTTIIYSDYNSDIKIELPV